MSGLYHLSFTFSLLFLHQPPPPMYIKQRPQGDKKYSCRYLTDRRKRVMTSEQILLQILHVVYDWKWRGKGKNKELCICQKEERRTMENRNTSTVKVKQMLVDLELWSMTFVCMSKGTVCVYIVNMHSLTRTLIAPSPSSTWTPLRRV